MSLFTSLFSYEDGSDVIRKNKNGKMLCSIKGCNRAVHDKGKKQGGLISVCAPHYLGKHVFTGGYKIHKKDYCENQDGRLGMKCTYTVFHQSSLTVDHINNNHSDNRIENLQTLCGGCHNVKTAIYGRNFSTDLQEILEEFELNKQYLKVL